MLFDDNIGFITYSFAKNDDLTTIYEGFNRGNMFNNLYDKYKNYPINKLQAKNKKEDMILEIMALSFAINDLNLYLDLHPNDYEYLKKFKEYVDLSCKKEMEYVKLYGPLEVIDSDDAKKFIWINNPWPWESESEAKYV